MINNSLFLHGFNFSVISYKAQFFASSRLTYMNSFISVRNSVVALLRISDKFSCLISGRKQSLLHTKNINYTLIILFVFFLSSKQKCVLQKKKQNF